MISWKLNGDEFEVFTDGSGVERRWLAEVNGEQVPGDAPYPTGAVHNAVEFASDEPYEVHWDAIADQWDS